MSRGETGGTPATPLHPLNTNDLQLADPLHCSGKRYISWESRFRIGNSPEHHRSRSGAAPQLQGIQSGMEARGARVTQVRAEGITRDYTDYTDEEATPDPDGGFPLTTSRNQ